MTSFLSTLWSWISSFIWGVWGILRWLLFGDGQYLIAVIGAAVALYQAFRLRAKHYQSVREAMGNFLNGIREAVRKFQHNLIRVWPGETLAKRRIVAADIRSSAKSFENNRTNNAASLEEVKAAARSANRFGRCYAIDALGRIELPDLEMVQIVSEALRSRDPYVREVAAQALFRMGKAARDAEPALIAALAAFPNEGTGYYAVMALDRIAEDSQEIRDSLQRAAFAPNSMVTVQCKILYEKFTGSKLKSGFRE
jgi:hypothetical protein